jgi:N-acetylmuramoyl-L-alanine amidase
MTKNQLYTKTSVLLLLASITAFAKINFNIVYPREGRTIQAAPSDSAFIFGSVLPLDTQIQINNKNITVLDNGAFIAYVPIKAGHFVFECKAFNQSDSVLINRSIFIPPLMTTTAGDSLVIEDEYMYPNQKVENHQGDLLRVSFKGTPGCKASFTIDGVRENIPMAEMDSPKYFYWGEHAFGDKPAMMAKNVAGIYEGSYLIQSLDWRENRKIVFHLTNSGGDTITKESPHNITIFDNSFPQMAEIKTEMATLRTGVNAGYYYFLQQGTKVEIDGRYGKYLKVKLSDVEEAWVQENDIRLLSLGTNRPKKIVNVLRVKDIGTKVRIKVFLGERIPIRIEQSTNPQQLLIKMFGVVSDTDWIKYESGWSTVKNIRWEQEAVNVYNLKISLNQKQQWGYNVYYDDLNNLILDINKSPKISGWPHSPLKGISVLLDPGHLPDTGAVGPTESTEADVNYKLALKLEKELRTKGAMVYLTRRDEHGISLRARKKLAENFGANILLSLHHNALPDGINPFRNRGTSTYYYHPASSSLAVSIQTKLLQKLGLDNFGLYYDNLAMCRPTQMPSVLIEPAFLMFPEEERLINSDEYRNKCSKAIVEGLEEFLKNSKE